MCLRSIWIAVSAGGKYGPPATVTMPDPWKREGASSLAFSKRVSVVSLRWLALRDFTWSLGIPMDSCIGFLSPSFSSSLTTGNPPSKPSCSSIGGTFGFDLSNMEA